jgi:endonuclease/exonuclease/phosphatase family metal-dependent hydrolase
VRLLTYNVRNGRIREERHTDALNNWEHRRAAAIALIEAADPDVLALQEDCDEQLAEIRASFGTSHDVYCDAAFYEADLSYNAILVRKSLQVADTGAFWIAGDGTAQTKIDGSICHRHATYVLLPSIPLLIVNVHLDHTADRAVKQKEMRVFLDVASRRTPSWPQSTIVLGDFNSPPDTAGYALMATTGFSDAARLQGCEQPTALHWPPNSRRARIDYIWLSDDLKDRLDAYSVLDGRYRRIDGAPGHASDHSAVLAELSLAVSGSG